MDLRRSVQSSWAWLALGALALAATRGQAAWARKDVAEANDIPGAQGSRSQWCAQVCGGAQGDRSAGLCPDPCPRCAPPSLPPPCPALPPIPKCPACPEPVCPKPVCPPLPPIPPCPQPLVNLTCPESSSRCPAAACAKCPSCPPPPRQSPVRKPRPPGYEGWPTAPVGIYKLYKNKASWNDANNTCFKEGAHLVIPNIKAEVDVLTRMMKTEKVSFLYVGFHDNHQEGQYLSVLGNPMDSEQKKMWEKNQPEGGRGENCAVLYDSGLMHDYPCSVQFSFVCEVPY